MSKQPHPIRVNEIFGPTIQGEGLLIGQPTVFVRTGGCDYRCDWCDTLHAVDPRFRADWRPLSVGTILAEVERLSGAEPLLVTLSGGNPALQPLEPLIRAGQAKGYRFALETQGSVAQDWFALLDHLTLSPKPPSSGMDTDFQRLEACFTVAGGAQCSLKIVVFDEVDYLYARDLALRYPTVPFVLQPGNHTPPAFTDADTAPIDLGGIMNRLRWLIDRAQADHWHNARILPQLHVLIWGNERGV